VSAGRSRVPDPEEAIRKAFREAGYVDGWTDAVLADYAHELAEKQRKHFTPRPPGETADYVRGLDDGLDMAADLLDPEAGSGGK
jgi:hypothetical protein